MPPVGKSVKKKKRPVGRPAFSRKDIPEGFFRYYDAYRYGFMNKREFAEFLGVSRPTLDRYFETILVAALLSLGEFLDSIEHAQPLFSVTTLADEYLHSLEVWALRTLMSLVMFNYQVVAIGCQEVAEGALLGGTRDGGTLLKLLGDSQGVGKDVKVIAGASISTRPSAR